MSGETTISMECPSDAELVERLEGRHGGADDERLEQHLAACSACRALLDELGPGGARLSTALAAALGETRGRRAAIGRYRDLSVIGRGGMGEVHAAYDPELDRRVALKLLHTAQGSEAARRRLLREARALGKLSHPNVVQVYDVGEHAEDVFVAMELVEGQSFDAWCRGAPRPGWQAVLAAYLDAARGLSAAHDKGLVHRDVKPSNLLRGADGRVRVVDFGLAAASGALPFEAAASHAELRAGAPDHSTFAVDATWFAPAGREGPPTARLTATGAVVGTPLYMAPEQHEGLRASPAADQYSLCTALYEGLYGALPFAFDAEAGSTLGDIIARKLDGPPAVPPPGAPVPIWIHHALQRGLALRPEDRYPSIPALIAALTRDPEADCPRAQGSASHPARALEALPEAVGRVPRPITPLVGRADEVRAIAARVGATRLLTLTGSGGVGKSRLALQIASDLARDFADGAWFVELAPLADPELVTSAVARVLGVHEAPDRALFDQLVASLRGRRALLVLDNCEHVLDAASSLAARLLHACGGLSILATSRQSLGLTGEDAFRVPSLVVAEAVALFHARAGQKDDPDTVAQICQRLDGIPLAIELAAARTRVLSVAQIAERLDDRFRLLTDGSRSALPRHRTLKAAVDWGYQLLSDDEQALLRRLSVFAGGCTLEAADAVAGRDALDLLANLVDKSLVVFSGRYRLLETVRQYAAERLAEHGETEEARGRHLDYFVKLAEAAEPHIFGGDGHRGWIDRLEAENDNLRAAFDFCEAAVPRESASAAAEEARRAEAALRLAAGVHWFWFARGHLREGSRRLTVALRRGALVPARVRARGLAAAGAVATCMGHYATALDQANESLALGRELGDIQNTAYALCGVGGATLHAVGQEAARPILIEAVALSRAQENNRLVVFALYWLASADLCKGDLVTARGLLEEGLSIALRQEYRPGIGHTLFRLGEVAESTGDPREARRYFLDSLRSLEESADRWGIAQVLDALGRLRVIAGQPERGALLLGAVEALCELTGAQVLATERQRRAVATARRALGEPGFAAAWTRGRALRLEQALSDARRD